MFPHLQPEYVSNTEVNNKQNDYDVFYFTFRSSARQGGTVNEPTFSLGLNGLLGNPNFYDQNHIYIIPTFFSAHTLASVFNLDSHYFEVRVSPFQAQNENNKTGNPFVLLRSDGEVFSKNSKSLVHLNYNTFNRENNKGLRLPYGVFNYDNITLSVNDIEGNVVDLNNASNESYNKDFILQFKIVCYKK